LLPPFRGRDAFFLFLITVSFAILITPLWEGVHWGPRLILFALPLLLVDLKRTGRARGWLFYALLALTALQTLNSAAVVSARSKEMSDRIQLSGQHLGSPVVCSTMYQCADLAPLWGGREFFRVSGIRELRQLAIQFRESGIDTFFLHLDSSDPLFIKAFPKEGPIVPYRMTVLKAGSLYKTMWRIFELPMNKGDSLWAPILQTEAGELMKETNYERALKLQRVAVTLRPANPEGHYDLGLILGAIGREDEAMEEIHAALDCDSSFTPAKDFLKKIERNLEPLP
jgi:hypothetical protein